MRNWLRICACVPMLVIALTSTSASAATYTVAAGGNLQAVLNTAVGGDVILLAPGATFTGTFTLPVHGGTGFVTVRSGASDALLPPAGTRITPAYVPYLARIVSGTTAPALRTAPGAAFWRIECLEFPPTARGSNDIVAIGDGSSAQNSLAMLPHDIVLDRIYVHGDPLIGQKRAIALNAGRVSILNSWVSDIKAVGQDSQAIAGWNGSGPYTIENNYLEAAGNGILFGGDDPKIPNLVASDITVRGNTVTRPVAWRSPIVPTPAGVRASAGASGTLAAGTYGYRVLARRNVGTGTGVSTPAAEVLATVGANGSVTLAWTAVPDAADYVVYGRATGAPAMAWVTSATTFTDTGVAGAAGTPPSLGTVWTVKNLFELKNAQRVRIDHNRFENNWAQAQTGVAILFTPRNQYGGCTWCVVQDVTFEYNIIRHVGSGISLTGHDDVHPSLQSNRITIRHNEVSDYSRDWGGNGYVLNLSDQPRDVTVDHNTLVSGRGAGVVLVSGNPISGFTFTNNVAKHDTYGILGSGVGYGTTAITAFFPDGVVTRNVLAGATAPYPPGNLFPSLATFQGHFVDATGANYEVLPGTDWTNAGTDGLTLGADYDGIRSGARQADAAISLALTTPALADAVEQQAYVATVDAQGGTAPYAWQLAGGTLPAGLGLDPLNGSITGVPMAAGDVTATVQVVDARGGTASRPYTLHVASATLPLAITTDLLTAVAAGSPVSQVLAATGGSGSYLWAVSAGRLPTGLSLAASGLLSGTTTEAGSFAVGITVADADDATRTATRTFTLGVSQPTNTAPTISIAAPVAGAVLQAGSTVSLSASAADTDGSVARVDFFVDGVNVGSAAASPWRVSWVVRGGGSRTVTAIAVDNRGAAGTSAAVVVRVRREVVIYAGDVTRMAGRYQLASDASAAGGRSLLNPNARAAKVPTALARPTSYAEFTFYAEAGVPYHLWIRGAALGNDYNNDSAFVQFSGVAAARIGTTASFSYLVEEGTGAVLAGWGWQDTAYGIGALAAPITFESTGAQTVRVQPREDGLAIDQIVLSPANWLSVAPGAARRDTTIVPK